MALRTKSSHLTTLLKRCQSTQAAKKPATVNIAKQPVVTSLSNGVIAVSAEPDAPVTRVAVVISAGSRYERNDQQGITHYLRLLSSQSAMRMTSLGLVRSTQQMGANISCTSHREYMMYSAECLREHTAACVERLRLVSTTPAFKPWEVTDLKKYIDYDLAILQNKPNIKCIEMIVEAAYRDTVGRSLYVPEYNINKFKPEDLMEYVMSHYTEGNVAVVGLGVDHDEFLKAVETFQVHPATGRVKPPAKYHSGELRLHTKDPIVYATVCAEGVGYGNKDAYPAWVLQGIMGTGPRIKWSGGTGVSRLGQAVDKLDDKAQCTLSCVNTNYSDCGLFGFMVAADADKIDKVLPAACKEFSALSTKPITDEEVKRGKQQAKAALHMCLEEGENRLLDLGDNALWSGYGNGAIMPAEEVGQHIDTVTTAQVNVFAKKVLSTKLSMAAVGDLTHTPYLDNITKNIQPSSTTKAPF